MTPSAVRFRLLFAVLLPIANSTAVHAAEGHTVPLFDGDSLRGWTAENGCVAEARDGMLLLKEGTGWLRSDFVYGDFTLHVEWKALQAGKYDAGIYLRASADGEPFPRRGYQINLLQGGEGNAIGLAGATSTGLVKPAGEWNTFDITCAGESLALEINGKPAYRVTGATIPRGYVGIQVEVPKGGQFLLRNLTVTEHHHASLLGEAGFTHWEGVGGPAEACWEVVDGVLTCTKRSGPWLRSREEHGDFNLRLEYRVPEGGNSGIYVRVPENGSHHRDDENQPPAGFEVQVLDDAARAHADLKDYQYSASVYDIAGASPRVSRPPGEWNTLEINCRGDHVTTTHNGRVVVDITAETHPLLRLRETRGFLGLQNHGAGTSFRRLRVGPAAEYDRPQVEK